MTLSVACVHLEPTLLAELAIRLESRLGPVELIEAANGHAAVAIAASRPLHLVIARLSLPRPGLTGATAMLRVRELQPTVASLLVSEHSALARFTGEAASRLVKPDPELVATAAAELLDSSPGTEASALPAGGAEGCDPTLGEHTTEAGDETSIDGATDPGVFIDEDVRLRALAAGPQSGDLIAGKYRLEDSLGQGGMGVVFRAVDTFIQRPVAIKLLRVAEGRHVEEVRRRMRREAMISGRLTHPNIVTLHDAGVEGSQVYLVMELIQGHTLRELLSLRGPLPTDEAIAITLAILDALSHAHAIGIVHRDLKPENVLISSNRSIKVADFGIAKILDIAGSGSSPQHPLENFTAEGLVIGTLAYMAPEQLRGEVVDLRADIYAVGAMLFEMVGGARLADVVSPVGRALNRGLEPERIDTSKLNRRLAQVLDKALAVSRDQRISSSEAFIKSLHELDQPAWKRWLSWRA